MAKGNKWYTSLSWTVRLIIAIIIPVGWIVHVISRITSGRTLSMVVGVISIFAVGIVLDIVDIITTAVTNRLFFN